MSHRTAAYTLAVLVAALTLTGPDRAAAATVTLLQEGSDLGRLTSNRLGEADLDEFLEGLDNDWFASRSLIEVSTGGHIPFITLNKTPTTKSIGSTAAI